MPYRLANEKVTLEQVILYAKAKQCLGMPYPSSTNNVMERIKEAENGTVYMCSGLLLYQEILNGDYSHERPIH